MPSDISVKFYSHLYGQSSSRTSQLCRQNQVWIVPVLCSLHLFLIRSDIFSWIMIRNSLYLCITILKTWHTLLFPYRFYRSQTSENSSEKIKLESDIRHLSLQIHEQEERIEKMEIDFEKRLQCALEESKVIRRIKTNMSLLCWTLI